MFTGHASIELEALNSDSGKQLVAFIETEPGKKYNWTKGVTKGVKSYMLAADQKNRMMLPATVNKTLANA